MRTNYVDCFVARTINNAQLYECYVLGACEHEPAHEGREFLIIERCRRRQASEREQRELQPRLRPRPSVLDVYNVIMRALPRPPVRTHPADPFLTVTPG